MDSADGENELAPFRNVMNEMYARDISRKVRSSHRIRGNAGEPLSQPPYGYMKSPDNPKFWIIDEEAAQIVRSVFKMCIEGKGNETIACFGRTAFCLLLYKLLNVFKHFTFNNWFVNILEY